MQGPHTKSGLSIGFETLLLSLSTNRMLLFTVSPCLGRPGQNWGISNNSARTAPEQRPHSAPEERPWRPAQPNGGVWAEVAGDFYMIIIMVILMIIIILHHGADDYTVRSRYKRIVYKRIWVASLPFRTM